MKSAGWYIMRAGERIWRATKAEIRDVALAIANETGKPVTVRPAAAPKAAKPKPRTMTRNPDPGSFMDVWRETERHRQARLDYGKATKATRLAKGLRRTGTSTAAHERGAQKSARFSIDAKNAKERFTLYRPSRSAADRLADEFKAAGYTVTVREV